MRPFDTSGSASCSPRARRSSSRRSGCFPPSRAPPASRSPPSASAASGRSVSSIRRTLRPLSRLSAPSARVTTGLGRTRKSTPPAYLPRPHSRRWGACLGAASCRPRLWRPSCLHLRLGVSHPRVGRAPLCGDAASGLRRRTPPSDARCCRRRALPWRRSRSPGRGAPLAGPRFPRRSPRPRPPGPPPLSSGGRRRCRCHRDRQGRPRRLRRLPPSWAPLASDRQLDRRRCRFRCSLDGLDAIPLRCGMPGRGQRGGVAI